MIKANTHSSLVFTVLFLSIACSCWSREILRRPPRFPLQPPEENAPSLRCNQNLRGFLPNESHVEIARVSDGDTFVACVLPEKKVAVKIRIQGIDCPESTWNSKCERDGQEGRLNCDQQVPLGQAAKAHAKTLLLGKTVRLSNGENTPALGHDVHGRSLAYVALDNDVDYGFHMVENGMCDDYSWRHPHPRQATYLAASRH